MKILEQIFSIKNYDRYKQIKILFLKIKIKNSNVLIKNEVVNIIRKENLKSVVSKTVVDFDSPLRILQKANTIFLKDITDIFDKNNLNYCAMGGTLLGAIRHNGFIPFDDDIDLMMVREDYDKVVDIINNELYNDKIYCTKGDAIRIFYKGTPLQIDIFPFDIYSKYLETDEERNDLKVKIEKIQAKIKYDFSREMTGSTIVNYTEEQLVKIREELLSVDQITEKKLLLYGSECIGKNPAVLELDWVFPAKIHVFENIMLKIPAVPECVLFQHYGFYDEIVIANEEHINLMKRFTPKSLYIMLNIIERKTIY